MMRPRFLAILPSQMFWVSLALVFVVGAWWSSGTLSPYAASYREPHVIEPCQYLGNVDHAQFMAHLHMLRGEPRELWAETRVLRRILYPLLVFPFVAVAGVEWGGLIANVAIHLVVAWWFLRVLHDRFGRQRARCAAVLLSTYPGALYWIGLPYSYALIVPGCLVLAIALYHLDAETLTLRSLIGWSTLVGVVCLGYDLLPFFGPAALWVLLVRRRVTYAVITAILLVAPNVLVALILAYVVQVPMMNENTQIYANVLGSYLGWFGFSGWTELLGQVPVVFLESFFAGNFFMLPAVFVLAVAASWAQFDRIWFDRVESAILASTLAVFLVNNLAPHYPGWEMRGMWISRLYQPAFVAYVLYVARMLDSMTGRPKRVLATGIVLCVVVNGAIVLSPLLAWSPGLTIYARFYKHAPIDMMEKNLETFGRRPLGFCRASD